MILSVSGDNVKIQGLFLYQPDFFRKWHLDVVVVFNLPTDPTLFSLKCLFWLGLTCKFILLFTLQLDLKLEAENLLKFQNLMNGYENIKFPTPITPFVTNSVLVESFEVK